MKQGYWEAGQEIRCFCETWRFNKVFTKNRNWTSS
jgi:hypothetical protein